MDCKDCAKNEQAAVPYYEAESQSYRANRSMRYMATVFCVAFLIIALVVGVCVAYINQVNQHCMDKIDEMNRYWIDFISQYEFEGDSYEYSQDGRGLNIIGDNNGVSGYEPKTEDNETDNAP